MKKYILPFIVAGVIITCYVMLVGNYRNHFEQVLQGYRQGTVIQLDKKTDATKLAECFVKNGYISAQEDATFAAEYLTSRLAKGCTLESVFDLNSIDFRPSAEEIDSAGSPHYRQKVADERARLGLDSIAIRHYQSGSTPSVCSLNQGGYQLSARIVEPLPKDSVKLYQKIIKADKRPVEGVLVRLDAHRLDSLEHPTSEVVDYAMTDSRGKVLFRQLDGNTSYSMTPIGRNRQYGRPKGTVGCHLKDYKHTDRPILFVSAPHTVKLFDTATLRRIKQDGALTVRTPNDITHTFTLYMVLFFAGWLIVFILGRLGRKQMDIGMASVMMMLTGLSMLLMFGINDATVERMLGRETADGIICGIGLTATWQLVNLVSLYRNGWFDIPSKIVSSIGWLLSFLGLGRGYRPLKRKVMKFLPQWIQDRWRQTVRSCSGVGAGYLVSALLITCSLMFIGYEVGGMKVNLYLGTMIQPSEITKFLMVFFMAAYFSKKHRCLYDASCWVVNADKVKGAEFGRMAQSKFKQMAMMLTGLALLMGIYLLLGDMGPALVLALTFITLYAMVMSKVQMDDEEQHMGRLLARSELGMLIIGAGSFLVMVAVGKWMGTMWLAVPSWLVGWGMVCWFRRKIYDAAILFNLMTSLFLFGPAVLRGAGLDAQAGRLEARNEMCVNTWGELGLQEAAQDAGVNSQVAEGLWGLASGGWSGQGIGKASAHYIPAFHTDMILQSIGEQTGFIGICIIVLLLSLLLHRALHIGYRSGHTFTLYLCTGIAVVTAIQFFIIALGSTGIIPLTGISVPMLSYGKVSMILNISAFGIVLSVSSHTLQKKTTNVRPYNPTIALMALPYAIMTALTLSVFAYYQLWERESTLIRPVFVRNTDGLPVVRYNPRINELVEAMHPGDIYDRKGVLLATSDKTKLQEWQPIYSRYNVGCDIRKVQRRYYPFGRHTAFLVGDYNTRLFFTSVENSPKGYVAEARHLSALRGYDNKLYNDGKQPVKVDLSTDSYRPGRFLPADRQRTFNGFQLRDYSALLPYLKEGTARHTEVEGGVQPKDIHLTIDAELQTALQQKLEQYDRAGQEEWHRFQRISIVIIDAQQGDLLASANYPLPDTDRLASLQEEVYSDNARPADFQAYTDMDLGLVYPTPPGSTAKLLSALAGLKHMDETGGDISRYQYRVYQSEIIHRGRHHEPIGKVDMRTAIVQSSNCYFIDLVNDLNLYDELAQIYGATGVQIGYNAPYRFDYRPYNPQSQWAQEMVRASAGADKVWHEYMDNRNPHDPKTLRRMASNDAWRWTWGQGTLSATPLAMARAAGSVAAGGSMAVTRYTLDEPVQPTVPIVSPEQAEILKQYMAEEATRRIDYRNFHKYRVGGKSGTPERVITGDIVKGGRPKTNDAWYVCYIDNAQVSTLNPDGRSTTRQVPLAVAVRVERTGDALSGYPKLLTDRLVMETLEELGYLTGESLR